MKNVTIPELKGMKRKNVKMPQTALELEGMLFAAYLVGMRDEMMKNEGKPQRTFKRYFQENYIRDTEADK